MKAKTREEYEKAWRSHFAGLSSLTLQCDGVKANQLHAEMRDCFETILRIAAAQTFGSKEGNLTRTEIK